MRSRRDQDRARAQPPRRAARSAWPALAARRLVALVAAAALVGVCALPVSSSAGPRALGHGAAGAQAAVARAAGEDEPAAPAVATTVGLRVITFVDSSREVHFHNGRVEPRTLVTEIRYPALGSAAADDVRDAAPMTAAGPFPLVVFAHGYAATPDDYEQLLDAWARAGYVVAAPLFPLTQRHVPGGRREKDLINQPADMTFVINRMLAQAELPASFLHGLIDPQEIAVAGHSDGAATALAEAYDPAFADPRIAAAIILAGAELSLIDDSIPFPTSGPALLAAQGSADTLNEPSATYRYFAAAPAPKFLLMLIGATHGPPYTTQQPYLGVVEAVTIAFLDHYLRGEHDSLLRMREAGNVAGVATLGG